jgi:hypothetical protein
MEIRRSAPLCLAWGSGRGGAVRGWARIGAAPTMWESGGDVKSPFGAVSGAAPQASQRYDSGGFPGISLGAASFA